MVHELPIIDVEPQGHGIDHSAPDSELSGRLSLEVVVTVESKYVEHPRELTRDDRFADHHEPRPARVENGLAVREAVGREEAVGQQVGFAILGPSHEVVGHVRPAGNVGNGIPQFPGCENTVIRPGREILVSRGRRSVVLQP